HLADPWAHYWKPRSATLVCRLTHAIVSFRYGRELMSAHAGCRTRLTVVPASPRRICGCLGQRTDARASSCVLNEAACRGDLRSHGSLREDERRQLIRCRGADELG